MNNKILLTTFFILGLIIGTIAGFYLGIDIVINKMVKILPRFVNISIDYQTMQEALFRYDNNIGGCL